MGRVFLGVIVPIGAGFIVLEEEPKTPAIFDRIRSRLGTQNMSLEEMVARMRSLRDTSDYETLTSSPPSTSANSSSNTAPSNQ
jgi:hypothetical protein